MKQVQLPIQLLWQEMIGAFCVQTMGGFYYKYAFSALYYPIYIAFRSNPVYMYKAMISFNMLIMSFIPVISYHILQKAFKNRIKKYRALLNIRTCSWYFLQFGYMQCMPVCDVMLIFLPWPILLVILELSSTTSKTVRNVLSAVLAFVTVYGLYDTYKRCRF